MKHGGILLAGLLAVMGIGCEDDGGGSGVSGTWTGSGHYTHAKQLPVEITLVLTQNGNAVSGSYDITRPNRHMVGSVSGTITGNTLDLTMTPHGLADGTVSGDTMTLDWWEEGLGEEGTHAIVTLTRQ